MRIARYSPLALVLVLTACVREGESESGSDDIAETSETDSPCEPFPVSEVAGCPAIVGEGFCSEGANHLPDGTTIEWLHNPPHSGDHYPSWESEAGEHADPVARENWVHNLEHGWVVLVYDCPDGCEAELDVLRSLIEMRPDASILLTPDPLLEGSRFAAISWTWVHEFDAPALAELLCFVDQHFDNAPESIP